MVQNTASSAQKPFTCNQCNKCFNRQEDLLRHRTQKTHIDNNQWDECYSQAQTLRMFHERKHTSKETYLCIHCGKYFNHAVNLRQHAKLHTGEKPFECKQCGKCFNQARSLQRHTLLHTGKKHYECKQCGKCLKKPESSRNHVKVHSIEKLCECKQDVKYFCRGGHLMTLKKASADEVAFSFTQSEKTCNLNITKGRNCSILPVARGSNCDIKSNICALTSNFQEPKICLVECWICQEELCSQAQLLKHYDNHMK